MRSTCWTRRPTRSARSGTDRAVRVITGTGPHAVTSAARRRPRGEPDDRTRDRGGAGRAAGARDGVWRSGRGDAGALSARVRHGRAPRPLGARGGGGGARYRARAGPVRAGDRAPPRRAAGCWRAEPEGLFVALVFAPGRRWRPAVDPGFELIPGPGSVRWVEIVAEFRPDGAGHVLLDADGHVVARLTPRDKRPRHARTVDRRGADGPRRAAPRRARPGGPGGADREVGATARFRGAADGTSRRRLLARVRRLPR